MIDIFDSETLVKTHRSLYKRCEALDRFINKYGLYFCPTDAEYGAVDLYENIENLMERKNRLINLKIILDSAIKRLNEKDRKVILIKMKYNLSIEELCGVLNLKERTAFRRIEHAYASLAHELNNSKYADRVERTLNSETWLKDIREEIKERRSSYKEKVTNNL